MYVRNTGAEDILEILSGTSVPRPGPCARTFTHDDTLVTEWNLLNQGPVPVLGLLLTTILWNIEWNLLNQGPVPVLGLLLTKTC